MLPLGGSRERYAIRVADLAERSISDLQRIFNDCNWDNSDSASVDSDYILFSSDSSAISSSHVYRPVLATLGAANVWDLSRVGLGSGITGNILGLSYTAAR